MKMESVKYFTEFSLKFENYKKNWNILIYICIEKELSTLKSTLQFEYWYAEKNVFFSYIFL